MSKFWRRTKTNPMTSDPPSKCTGLKITVRSLKVAVWKDMCISSLNSVGYMYAGVESLWERRQNVLHNFNEHCEWTLSHFRTSGGERGWDHRHSCQHQWSEHSGWPEGMLHHRRPQQLHDYGETTPVAYLILSAPTLVEIGNMREAKGCLSRMIPMDGRKKSEKY